MTIRIGTRGSQLALWQAHHVQSLLEGAGYDTEIVLYKTTGDIQQGKPLHTIGERGLFTKALDEGLLKGEIDLAVHSSKDMPSRAPEGLAIAAFLKREDPRDVLLAIDPEVDLDNFNRRLVIGTGSLRRQALLGHYAGHCEVKPIRGNVDTRVKKLEAGEYDGIVLAYAGVKRMGMTHLIRRKLNVNTFTPAVGQGAVAVAMQTDHPLRSRLHELLDHGPTSGALRAERAFLYRLEGGCHTPAFALATTVEGRLSIQGGVASLDGSVVLRDHCEGPVDQAEQIGVQLAELLLLQGATDILNG